jgi:alpha-1,6-mannosyltransferase
VWGALAGPHAVGSAALAALTISVFALAAGAAGGPSTIVPLSSKHFPGWMAGPLHVVGLAFSGDSLEVIIIVIGLCYAAVLSCARALDSRALWTAIVLAHVAALLAPPLFSGDVFGYIGFARLGVLHGISPYLHGANAAPGDAIVPYLGWHNVTTPYGPLFTLLSYALVPLGIAGAFWALKVLAAATSLATVALVWLAAKRLHRSPGVAVALYGLNPLVLIFAVAGAHNETLFGMFVAAGALWVCSGRERLAGVSLVCASALKASAALILPFALIGAEQRRRLALSMLAAAAVVAVVAGAVFGTHVLGAAGALATEQRQVAVHSVPSEVSRGLGLGRLAAGVRVAFLVAFALALLAALWRTLHGSWWLDCYAWATLALLACSGWLLPWYGLWALLPASLSGSRRLRVVALVACAYLVATRLAVASPVLG